MPALAPSSSAADDPAPRLDPLPTLSLGKRLLSVEFDPVTATPAPGAPFTVRGSVHRLTQDTLALLGATSAATFTLAVDDARGATLATRRVTTAPDGSFTVTIPASATEAVATDDGAVSLALRALDVRSGDGFQSTPGDEAGSTSVALRSRARGLRVVNRFVSSRGWVKPGEKYPSSIVVTNPTSKAVSGARVELTAPVGTRFLTASGPGSTSVTESDLTWRVPRVAAGRSVTLVVDQRAASLRQLPTLVWRDLSTTAVLTTGGRTAGRSTSHGPKVIPPGGAYDSARYGDRPFPVVPVQYTDRRYVDGHSGAGLERVINSPANPGSTFNLFQEMSLGQLYPHGTVPSAGIASADFDYAPGFPTYRTDLTKVNTCTGVTLSDLGATAFGSPLYSERITDGVYNLPGTTGYYGADGNGSAVIGSLTGIAALQNIDSGCGDTSKIVQDAAALADPEIDYNDYDTDKDGLVDFFMVVYAGCGGHGESQGLGGDLACGLPYDNIWPHSSSLEYSVTDPVTGLDGFATDDQLRDLEGRPLYWTDGSFTKQTTRKTAHKVFVRVGPYNLNPETAIERASVISHEYGHSLGLPDFYTTGSATYYDDWTLMSSDKSQNIDAYGRQELGWVVPEVLGKGSRTVRSWPDSKQDTGVIRWRTASGEPYVLRRGRDGIVHNSRMYVAKLPGRVLMKPSAFDTGVKASKSHAWFSGSGNDFGCNATGGGHNLDLSLPALAKLPSGSRVSLSMKSYFSIEWDFDYGFVLTSKNGGGDWRSNASTRQVPTTTASSNPNSNACQGTYGNGITGSSSSYSDPLTAQLDRTLGNQPAPSFIADTFDVSDLAGATSPVIRFSYATDPGLALPGWFIDDVKVTATLPSGTTKVIYRSDFEKSGGPRDPFVFNGGCKPGVPGGKCTDGWQYVRAGARSSDFDHAYYLEMRDRSGFDLDGRGQIDRDPISWQPGLFLAYADESRGYGNNGVDKAPAQTPLDAVPQPGEMNPNLADAAFTATKARSTYSDFGAGHVDNYTNPTGAGRWVLRFDCLAFRVLGLRGAGVGPRRSDGDLSGTVRIRTGPGCAGFDYDY
ncbi:immune inhibitor A domain-containing protein [Nocardioides sp. R-C-SC26]|uniref:immune inhibitor A domain-containing protein n=1 Tax=Nocardioides sp. R-C-SC26 TaxID=2870414 RepID=UPI001E463DC2|nr:immune inhibitor A domain-containing protein [Nocardioides sp. R-C-SC26]